MSMEEFIVNDFKGLHKILLQYRLDKRWRFRGHANEKWKLVPKMGRPPYSSVKEDLVFSSWKRRAIEFIDNKPETDWDWLAIAQHHGLVTRLLDWTSNPLNAAYFAVRESFKGNAIIYAVKFQFMVDYEQESNPFNFSGIAICYPSGVVPRISRQGGLFSVHGPAELPIEDGSEYIRDLHRIIISKSYRETLLSDLSYYGINNLSMFPDLDGLSKFINWGIESGEYFGTHEE
jgi:hypothetical protein